MRAQLRYDVEVEDPQDLEGLRDEIAETIRDNGYQVINQASSYTQEPFTLAGSYKGRPGDSWTLVIQASDEDDARDQVLGADKTRTINFCVPGDHLPPPEPGQSDE